MTHYLRLALLDKILEQWAIPRDVFVDSVPDDFWNDFEPPQTDELYDSADEEYDEWLDRQIELQCNEALEDEDSD